MHRLLYLALLALLTATPLYAQAPATPAPRGIGPFTVETARGTLTVRLLRRDRDLVWISQQMSSGQTVDTGLAPKEIHKFNLPRPRLFQAIDNATPDQAQTLQPQLEAFIKQLLPFRDLPGMKVDEAQLLLGRVLEQAGNWKAAAAVYGEIAGQPYQPAEATAARLRQGLCLAKLGQPAEALPLLDPGTLDGDDVELISDVYLARGDVLQQMARHQEAILAYLHLVVFLPYVRDNEARALAAVLPSYAALGDWESAYKTVQHLKKNHPESDRTKLAATFAEEHAEQMNKEAAFRGDTEAAPDAEKGITDEQPE